eukprot:scpid66776/ scgid12789/ Frizzled-10; FzE7
MQRIHAIMSLAYVIASFVCSQAAPTETASEDVLQLAAIPTIDYREAPVHIRPVREHDVDPDQTLDSALGAQAQHGNVEGIPPDGYDTALSGVEHRPTNLLATSYLALDRPTKCVPMSSKSVSMCGRFNYTMTRMPNLLNHQNQVEAYAQLVGYRELIASNCSQNLLFLLCTFHLPSCQDTGGASLSAQAAATGGVIAHVALVTPCRGLCESVRQQCTPVMRRYGFDWPWTLQCERLQSEPSFVEPQSEELVACVEQPPRINNDDSDQEQSGNNTHMPCEARTCESREVKRKTFKAYRYDWVVHARYLGMIVKDNKHSLQLRITSVLYKRPGHTPRRLKIGRELIVLTDQDETVCGPCPDMHILNTTYLVAGFARGSRLTYPVQTGIARDASIYSSTRILRWLKSLTKQYPFA